jgi:hypothetical protein
MNRTSLRDLKKSCALLARQLAADLKPPLNAVDVPFFRVALRAVDCMDPRMTQSDPEGLQRPAFASRVQRDSHRRSGAQSSQQQIIRVRACISPAKGNRLVCAESVRARFNRLRESRRQTANCDNTPARKRILILHSDAPCPEGECDGAPSDDIFGGDPHVTP